MEEHPFHSLQDSWNISLSQKVTSSQRQGQELVASKKAWEFILPQESKHALIISSRIYGFSSKSGHIIKNTHQSNLLGLGEQRFQFYLFPLCIVSVLWYTWIKVNLKNWFCSLFLKTASMYSWKLMPFTHINWWIPYNNSVEPSRIIGWGHCLTSETDTEEENRYVEFINVIQNSPLGKQKTLIKLIKTSYWHE